MLILILLPLFAHAVSVIKRSPKDLEGQLYEDLLYEYNKVPRPVKNSSNILTVDVGAFLIRIIDVDEKNQVLTTNLWLEMKWMDAKLVWEPHKYGGLRALHIPSDMIWTPDLVLYNNAAGDPDITIMTDALVTYEGQVFWQPPAIYKSFCSIDVTWFPYDEQKCEMKFGTWTYTGSYVDLKQLPKEEIEARKAADGTDYEYMERGMDLSFFYISAEWDLLNLTSERHSVLYASCCGPEKFVDITYYFALRRKTLFFTCNLIIPCFLISILTTFVFYLSDHKITFSISILVTLTVFFLVLIDLMPPTSLVIPMFGRYLITTMILVALSTVVSVTTVNLRFRSGSAYRMSPWIRIVFLEFLPKILRIQRPLEKQGRGERRDREGSSTLVNARDLVDPAYKEEERAKSLLLGSGIKKNAGVHRARALNNTLDHHSEPPEIMKPTPPKIRAELPPPPIPSKKTAKKNRVDDIVFINLLQQVRFIAEYFRHNERESEISDDWTFVAMVLDRLFLIIFSLLNLGTFSIILEAPSLRDHREPLNTTVKTRPLGMANLFSTAHS